MTQKSLTMKEKIGGLEYSLSEETTVRVTADWKEVFAMHITNKRLVSGIYK